MSREEKKDEKAERRSDRVRALTSAAGGISIAECIQKFQTYDRATQKRGQFRANQIQTRAKLVTSVRRHYIIAGS